MAAEMWEVWAGRGWFDVAWIEGFAGLAWRRAFFGRAALDGRKYARRGEVEWRLARKCNVFSRGVVKRMFGVGTGLERVGSG
jgi:hypothetical protein